VKIVSIDDYVLSKEQAEEILQRYFGTSLLVAGIDGILDGFRIKPLNKKAILQSSQIRVKDLLKCLGVKKVAGYALDTHLGQLSHYAWLKGEHPTGADFTPIFDAIFKIHKKYPAEQERLESLSRRLGYLCFVRDEIGYMNKKYDYEEIPIIFEFCTNKVEVFTTLLVDLLMVLAELWCDRPGSTITPGPRPTRFENLFACFFPLQQGEYQFFKSINIMLQLSAAISARHKYVHGIGPAISLTNDGGVIDFEIPVKNRYGEFERYMKIDLFNSLKKKSPAGGMIVIKDSRFPDFDFELKLTKKSKFDYRRSNVRYSAKVSQYVKMLERVLWMISRAVSTAILE
jgi:hypothetical protein